MGSRIRVGCLRCGVETTLGALDSEPSDALPLCEWLTEHIYNPQAGSGLSAPAACPLGACMAAPAALLDPESRRR